MSKKRYLAAFGAAGLMFAGVYGAAASLGVDGGVAQAGQDTNLTCDESVAVAGYFIEQGDNRSGPEGVPISNGVVVKDVADACDGYYLSASVYNSAGDRIGNGVVQIEDDKVTVPYNRQGGGGLAVEEIASVSLAIT